MTFRKKHDSADINVTYYDVSGGGSGRTAVTLAKGARKDTINLCKRERNGISLEKACILFAIIIAVVLLVEFFGIFRPYRQLEAKQAQLEADRAALAGITSGMTDIDSVRAEYRKYNYENFPRELVGRDQIFELLDAAVFTRGKITKFELSRNQLTLDVSQVNYDEVDAMQNQLSQDKLVALVNATAISGAEGGKATVRLVITFKDATL